MTTRDGDPDALPADYTFAFDFQTGWADLTLEETDFGTAWGVATAAVATDLEASRLRLKPAMSIRDLRRRALTLNRTGTHVAPLLLKSSDAAIVGAPDARTLTLPAGPAARDQGAARTQRAFLGLGRARTVEYICYAVCPPGVAEIGVVSVMWEPGEGGGQVSRLVAELVGTMWVVAVEVDGDRRTVDIRTGD
ncbi:hypothetical protein DI272_27115 [Streptomyces sp. Act143]|uniref:hypothetical protein n=1 Tax=Streptomyces sp. Act143 TaxID=2200760 RepID=UPI000D67FBB3|nr:hypothetical protein [Streptomyces sp. Act143]PWI17422.1 hypothetical protein DI272_27115 [Streptomyces sp. Act143]